MLSELYFRTAIELREIIASCYQRSLSSEAMRFEPLEVDLLKCGFRCSAAGVDGCGKRAGHFSEAEVSGEGARATKCFLSGSRDVGRKLETALRYADGGVRGEEVIKLSGVSAELQCEHGVLLSSGHDDVEAVGLVFLAYLLDVCLYAVELGEQIG